MKQVEDNLTADMWETTGEFTWNYRIVNLKSQNGGDDWYCLQEVHYMQGKPTGYAAPCLGSDNMENMRNVWDMMSEAMKSPPMQEEEFKLEHQN